VRARRHGGTVARWHGGTVARWQENQILMYYSSDGDLGI